MLNEEPGMHDGRSMPLNSNMQKADQIEIRQYKNIATSLFQTKIYDKNVWKRS